jgi:membrane protein YqaA with SNARE-associated domain
MAETAAAHKRSFMQKLYDWAEHWSQTHYGPIALFILAFIESSVFPVPPDVLLIALVLLNPKIWWYFAIICTAGSVIGGLFGYWIGYALWEAVGNFFLTYVFSAEAFQKVQHLYQQYDFWAVFAAAFTPIPYKVFTIAAGVFDLSIPHFTLASLTGRGGRFFLVAAILRIFGPKVKPFIEKYFNIISVVFLVLLIGGFVLIRFVMKH